MKPVWDPEPDPIVALSQGDPGPYEAYVRAAAGPLVGFFVRLGADPHEAEDLTQLTFVRLYQSASSYRPQERFSAYVFRIARNAWIDQRRRGGRAPVSADLDESASGLPVEEREPGERVETSEEAAKLLLGLGRLPDGQREVFELAVVQGRPYAEIGDSLGIPVGTVKSRMHHAVQRLREWMQAAPREVGR